MSRYIDADALNERMYHDAFETDSDMQKWDSGCWIRYKMFENALADAPTIDPVKHGHWYDEPNYLGTSKTMYFCSYCGSASYREDPYCWHCGAKMQGGKE